MNADEEDPGPVGGRPEDIRFFFKGSVAFQFGDVGPDPPYGAGHGQFPAQGCATDHQEASEEAGGGASSTGGSDGGGGF